MRNKRGKGENPYEAEGLTIELPKGPIFPVYDQSEVDLDCKDPKYSYVWVDGGGQGTAAIGVVVVEGGIITMTFGAYLGDNLTNNIA